MAEKIDTETQVLAAIAAFPEPDRGLAKRLHEIVRTTAPSLNTRLWYGMPAYTKDGNVICFFQPASKFKTRYGTFGFQHDARLDDGNMWPVAFAVTKLTSAEEAKIVELIKKAVN